MRTDTLHHFACMPFSSFSGPNMLYDAECILACNIFRPFSDSDMCIDVNSLIACITLHAKSNYFRSRM